MTRVEFINCKLSGMSLINANLKDVLIDNCNCSLTNFSNTNINNICINDSILNESFFDHTIIKNIEFDNVKFHQTEILHTNLETVDFSNSDISGIRMDSYSMKRIKVNSFQCRELVGILGVEVID